MDKKLINRKRYTRKRYNFQTDEKYRKYVLLSEIAEARRIAEQLIEAKIGGDNRKGGDNRNREVTASQGCHVIPIRQVRIALTPRTLKDLRTGRTSLTLLVDAELKKLKDTYPCDPEEGITIIEPPQEDEPYVPDLRPLGLYSFLNAKERYLFGAYEGKKLKDLKPGTRKKIVSVFRKLLIIARHFEDVGTSRNIITMMSSVVTSYKSEESEELEEQEERELKD